MPLHVSLLGAQSITEDATGAVRTRSSRTVALVAFLALHAGSPQTRQRIAGLFWPDSTDGQALTNLRRELHHLRRTLGDEPCLEVTAKDLCWRTPRPRGSTCAPSRSNGGPRWRPDDAESALRHAEAALAEYGGDLLPGLYDDWLLDARAELQAQAVELCALVCGTRAARGDLPGALEAARRRVRMAPLEEVGYRALMEVQADLGDRAGAVSTYHRCASVLERELGVVPDDATRATLQRVMAQHTATDAPRRPAEPATARPGRAPLGLVGRGTELARLGQVWQTAAAGRPSLAVVRGGAGVGKSRLVAELAALARRSGAVVAGSQCFGTAGRLALAPVADWLRSPAVQSATRTLDPVWRDEVDRLVPSGTGRASTVSGTRAMVDAWQRHRFLEGLARAPAGCRSADAARPGQPAVVRPGDPGVPHLLPRAVARRPGPGGRDAARRRPGRRAHGRGLGRPDARHRQAHRAHARPAGGRRHRPARRGDPRAARSWTATADLLQAATGGFPLHVVEAMRTAGGQDGALPAGDLEAVLRGRLDQASAAARELCRPGRRGRARLHPRPARRGQRPRRRQRGARGRRAVAPPDRPRARRRLRLLPRPAPRRRRTSGSARRGAGCCTGASPRASSCCTARTPDPVSAQLARAVRPRRAPRAGRRVLPPRGRGGVRPVRPRRGDPAALRGAGHRPGPAPGTRPRRPGARRPGGDGGTAQRALRLLLPAAAGGAGARGRARGVARTPGLGAQRPGRAVVVAVRPGTDRRRGPDRDPGPGPRRARLRAERRGPLRVRRLGGQPRQAGRGAAALRGRGRGSAPAPRSASAPGPTCTAWPGRRTRTGCSATTTWPWPAATTRCALARSIDHPYSLAVALAYGAITHQLRGDRPALRGAVAELAELCDRYGFAYYREWALVLDGWGSGGETGHHARPARHRQPAVGGLLRPDAVLALAAGRRPGPHRAA